MSRQVDVWPDKVSGCPLMALLSRGHLNGKKDLVVGNGRASGRAEPSGWAGGRTRR